MKAKTLFKLFCAVFFLAIIGGLAGAVLWGLENEALVPPQRELSVEDVERARRLIRQHDPRKMAEGERKSVDVSQRDMNLVIRYGASRLPGAKQIRSNIAIHDDYIRAAFTFGLPQNPLRSYMNISVFITEGKGLPVIQKVIIGKITFEKLLLRILTPMGRSVLSRFEQYPDVKEAASLVKRYEFKEKSLHLAYEWQPDAAEKLKQAGREILVSEKDRTRLIAYYDRLAQFSQTIEGREASLGRFMKPLFAHAKTRTDADGEPSLENQAIIIVLALYANGRSLETLIGKTEGGPMPQPNAVKTTLRNRQDLAKHFTLSAAIAATADSKLSNVIGLFKEIDDSRGGSGFSFVDLAADRAGVRFAEAAVGHREQARRLQDVMSGMSGESDFMPGIDNLPEGMMEMTFKQRYQDLDSDRFKAVKNEIERRIDECAVHQAL